MLHDTAHVYSSKTVGLLLAIIPQYHNVFKTSSVTFFQHWRGKYQYVSPLNAHTFPTRQFKRCGIFGIRAHSMRHGYRLTQIRCKMRKKTWEATRDNKWEASHVEAREIRDARVIVPSIQSAALRYTKSRRYMRRWNCKKKNTHPGESEAFVECKCSRSTRYCLSPKGCFSLIVVVSCELCILSSAVIIITMFIISTP